MTYSICVIVFNAFMALLSIHESHEFMQISITQAKKL